VEFFANAYALLVAPAMAVRRHAEIAVGAESQRTRSENSKSFMPNEWC
jgi:hypothetical protein